ncbi:MAG: hypothetical protein MUF20_05255 [Methylotetracoccus sp.]|jgi:hypothetical protein|nr:hypothetical protein [Methylotetracoccus sp.]
MRNQDELILMMKDMILLFALLACVGSFYHAKFVMGFAYLGAAAALYYEKAIRDWLRRHFSS